MKLNNLSIALFLGLGALTSCESKLELVNPNNQTSSSFGNTTEELEEAVIGCYNHARREGTYARVGYTMDAVRGDEVWNSSQVWYLECDNFTASSSYEQGSSWIWRDWYYTINSCNFVLSRTTGEDSSLSEAMKRIKGQALFLRGLSYYNLAGYFNKAAVITDYSTYSDINSLYVGINTYDEVMDQCEADLKEAMELLPSRDEGGEWAKGRATCGAAAGFYARALMMRHKYSEARTVLQDIVDKKYGTYALMANYGDNFQEGSAYENNEESLFEIQYLDSDSQGVDEEWTPVNTSANATQGHAVESNFAPGDFGGWADLSASPWLYHLFKAEKTTDGKADPRLYWTLGTYEGDWTENYPSGGHGNVMYTQKITVKDTLQTNNNYGGIVVVKNTNARTNIQSSVVTGLHCGINLRLMRYSDVLLRLAECINEIDGPTAEAIGYINQVRTRAKLPELKLSDFAGNADKLFEQIANVERPKEFGCEYGRGFDLIRWGFFYDNDRMLQMKQHAAVRMGKRENGDNPTDAVTYMTSNVTSSFDSYVTGHEYFCIYQDNLDQNANLGTGNCANSNSTEAQEYFKSQWTVHPVVDLSK